MATQSTGIVKQQLSISLTGGIDRKTDPKQLTNGQMYTADNVQYVTEKQCRKRFGYNTLTPPGGLQGAPFVAVGCRDTVEPIVLGTGKLNRYNTQTGLSTYLPAPAQGRLTSQVVTSSTGQTPVPIPPTGAAYASDNQDYLCVAWLEGNYAPFYYGLQDLVTGNWIISPRVITPSVTAFTVNGVSYTIQTYSALRAAYVNGYFYIFFAAVGQASSTLQFGSQVFAYGLNVLNGQAGVSLTNFSYTLYSASTIVVLSPIFLYDVDVLNGQLYLAAATNPFGNVQLNAYTANALTFTTSSTTTLVSGQSGSSANSTVAMAASASNQAIAIITAGYIYCVSVPSLTYRRSATANTDSNYSQSVCWGGNNFYYFNCASFQNRVRIVGAGYNLAMVQQISITSEGLSTVGLSNILSDPFYANGYVYVWVFTQGYGSSIPYRSQILAQFDISTGAFLVAARTGYQTSVYTNLKTQLLPVPIIQIPNTNQFMAFLSQSTIIQDKKNSYGSLSRVIFDITPTRAPQVYSLPAGGIFIAGAFPLQYDGQSLNEAGFTSAPDFSVGIDSIAAAPVITSPGGGIGPGTYSYYACFVRADAYGNIIRSAPSIAYVVTCINSSGSKVSFPALGYYNVTNVFLEFYRTTVATPSEPYYIGRTSNGVPYVDDQSDSAIVGNANLYTYSGEQPNDPPPAVHHMAIGETRAYIIPSDNRNAIWCSKLFSPGRTIEWTSNLILSEGGTHSGTFTAVAVLDTNVIVFKSDQILYFYGDGPDNTGASGSFSAFQKLASDVGCIDPGSLAIIPGGLLFRSKRGIELLSRGLQVQYVGAPIEPIIQGIAAISSTCVLPQYQQVRFVPSNANDPVLVFDYAYNRWSTYSGMSALACANVLNNYWWISQDGTTCNVETPGKFLDNGNPITMTLETPEIPMSTMQGWGRLYRLGLLGEYKSPHTLLTSFAYDHSQTYTDVVSYSVLDTASTTSVPSNASLYDPNSNMKADIVTAPCAEQFRMSRVPRQVMQTARIKLQDQPYNGYYITEGIQHPYTALPGESCAISNITLEVGQKAILAKLTGSKTV